MMIKYFLWLFSSFCITFQLPTDQEQNGLYWKYSKYLNTHFKAINNVFRPRLLKNDMYMM